MVWKLPVSGPWRVTADYAQIVIGSFLVGIGVNLLYVVVGAHEVGRLKLRVAEVDHNAFVAISKAQEVFGEGFTPPEPEAG